MKAFKWLTNGLDSANAAMSTAPPEQWADGRVIAVATIAFLLGALRSGREDREEANRGEIVAAIVENIELLEQVMQVDREVVNALRDKLVDELADTAERIQACEWRVDQFEGGQDYLFKKVAELEEWIKEQEKVPDELYGIVWSYRMGGKRALEAESEYKDVLNDELGTIKMLGSADIPKVPRWTYWIRSYLWI